ncbi:MAG: ATP-binding protein [Chthoniobacteraceae bacterium]
MSWITGIWSAAAGACLTLAIVHLLVWCWDHSLRASLWFAGVAIPVAAMAGLECSIMRVRTPGEFYALHRWGHVAFFVTIVCVVGFVRSYLRTGRPWLGWLLIAVRVLILILAFVPGPTFNFREVTALVPYRFLNETLMAPRGIPTPWENLGNLSGLLLVAFVLDAALRRWRAGDARERQRAVVVAAGVVLFILSCATNGVLIHHTGAQAPYFITLSFLFIVGAMGFELSRDLMNAAHLAEEVHENAESMRLAASAAQLALWRWDIPHDVIWVSPNGRGLYGIPAGESISLRRFLETLHVDDREPTRQTVQRAIESSGNFRAEYRVMLPDGAVRWMAARGKVESDEDQRPARMRGISIDITELKAAELEAAQHRSELTHLTRVTTLSELSGSLAHELNQPLAIILSNAQAAQRLLAQSPPDVAEVSDILADIVGEDRRAGEVIQRLRALLKRGETALLPVSLNEVIEDVLHLAESDFIGRGVVVVRALADDLPAVKGDRVQLQQVLLNLILNAADAMSANVPGARRIHISTARHAAAVRVSVRDEGCGLPADAEKLFRPFFTTKSHGLGMGLAICRTIIGAHSGKLWAEPHPERGAVFHFDLPALTMESA